MNQITSFVIYRIQSNSVFSRDIKKFLPWSSVYLSLLHVITLAIRVLGEWYKMWSLHFWSYSIPILSCPLVQIFILQKRLSCLNWCYSLWNVGKLCLPFDPLSSFGIFPNFIPTINFLLFRLTQRYSRMYSSSDSPCVQSENSCSTGPPEFFVNVSAIQPHF